MSSIVGMPDILVQSRLSRAHADTKMAWQQAQQEAVTGEAADPYKATGGDPTRVMAIERSVSTLDSREPLLSMARSRAGAMQGALDTIHAATETMGVQLLQDVEGLEISVARSTAKEAESALSHMMSALNTELSGRHLFGGARVGAPMPDAETVINDIKDIIDFSVLQMTPDEVTPAPSPYQAYQDGLAADAKDDPPKTLHDVIMDNIDLYFTKGESLILDPAYTPLGPPADPMDPPNPVEIYPTPRTSTHDEAVTGPVDETLTRSFDSRFAGGEDPPEPPPVELADGEYMDYAMRGDHDDLRAMIKGLSIAAAAVDVYGEPSESEQMFTMLKEAGETMMTATDALTRMRSDLGLAEARIEEAQIRNTAERQTLELARADLIGVDQYEAATRVTELETQLQAIYALTARSTQLSLLNYLR